MGRFALLLLAASGCSQLFGLDSPQHVDALTSDTTDSPAVDGDGCLGHTHICLTTMPPDRTFGAMTIDTSTGCDAVLAQGSNEPELCMVVGNAIRVTETLRATGPRPLLLVAATVLTIETNGNIDVASRTNQTVGAGANPAECVDGADGTDSTANKNAGGGAGATFQGKGGDGGSADTPGGSAVAPILVLPTHVRGGCKGRRGGIAPGAIMYSGGDGGGAVFLVAGTRIEIVGDINASGGGGKGGAVGGNGNCGGSGGGSGGLIWIDAPLVEISGDVFANGGGGGGASSSVLPGGTGGTSADPIAGGAGAGSSGGDGGALANMNGQAGTSSASGGGGGGGGGGVVQVFANQKTISGTISPPIM